MRILMLILSIWILSSFWTKTLGQGLEIYLVKHDYPDFTKEHLDTSCYYCFKPNKIDLFDSALIKQSDIEYFDWEVQTIKLNANGIKKLIALKVPLKGMAAAISIDNEPIYGFWFWNIVSSFGCDWVCTYPVNLGFKLQFGLPTGNTKGIDPRFDKRIEDYIIKTNLKK